MIQQMNTAYLLAATRHLWLAATHFGRLPDNSMLWNPSSLRAAYRLLLNAGCTAGHQDSRGPLDTSARPALRLSDAVKASGHAIG